MGGYIQFRIFFEIAPLSLGGALNGDGAAIGPQVALRYE
jgi:hypothetical protein